jgi:hypothetical protein
MKHAENRPPSAAHRWLSCRGSPAILKTYPNNSSDASIKGDIAHDLLEDGILFGVVPNHPDIDLAYSAMYALEKITETYNEYGGRGKCQIFAEQTLEIPETGEFGTTDCILLTQSLIHVIDYKNGYVPVDIRLNPQLLLYLCGAIAKFGERKHYRISIIQPNYVHADGMYRSMDVSQDDLDWFRNEVAVALLDESVIAGKHCKTTYCPHRGSCATFLAWSLEHCRDAWFPGEVNGMSDEQLAEALEQSEILQGYRDSLRGEAMRRILHQDRAIAGYKIVKAKKDRNFKDDTAKQAVFKALEGLGAEQDEIHPRTDISVAGVERVVKRIFKPQGRGAWMKGMDAVCPPEMLEPTNQSLTLEKSIDGRRAHKRGSEFGPLKQAPSVDATSNTTNTSEEVSIL